MLQTKYESSGPCGFGEEDFKGFPPIRPQKPFDPSGGANFDPGGIILTNFVDNRSMMLHAKYEGSGSYSFREEDFLNFHFFNPFLAPLTSFINRSNFF